MERKSTRADRINIAIAAPHHAVATIANAANTRDTRETPQYHCKQTRRPAAGAAAMGQFLPPALQ
jgi:hypothetical protein